VRVRFVLSNPAVPENVGAAARALTTCGFDELVLVLDDTAHASPEREGAERVSSEQAGAGPRGFLPEASSPGASPAVPVHLDERARWLAVGAGHVLDGVRVYPSLAEAIAGTDLAIGTTARHRSFPRPIIDSRNMHSFLAEKGDPSMYVSLVFGNEQNGLTNEELALCHVVSTIPLAQPYPSLNLGQAVMVFAYELAYGCTCGTAAPAAQEDAPPPDECSLSGFMEEVRAIMSRAGISPDEVVYRRLLEYFAHCNAYEIGALYTLFKRLFR
jgi:tRNA/rRNA methyltransferase